MDKLNNIANYEDLRFTQTRPLGKLHHGKDKKRIRRLLGRLHEYQLILIFRCVQLLYRMYDTKTNFWMLYKICKSLENRLFRLPMIIFILILTLSYCAIMQRLDLKRTSDRYISLNGIMNSKKNQFHSLTL